MKTLDLESLKRMYAKWGCALDVPEDTKAAQHSALVTHVKINTPAEKPKRPAKKTKRKAKRKPENPEKETTSRRKKTANKSELDKPAPPGEGLLS